MKNAPVVLQTCTTIVILYWLFSSQRDLANIRALTAAVERLPQEQLWAPAGPAPKLIWRPTGVRFLGQGWWHDRRGRGLPWLEILRDEDGHALKFYDGETQWQCHQEMKGAGTWFCERLDQYGSNVWEGHGLTLKFSASSEGRLRIRVASKESLEIWRLL